MRRVLEQALADGQRLLAECERSEAFIGSVEAAGAAVVKAFRLGGRVFSCGNGGSMSDAAHFAEEFSGRFRNDRPALPVLAFTDAAHITCVANDYGFEFVFSRMVEALGKPGDVLVLLTTSGNSANLIRAAQSARSMGLVVVGFVGKGGGALAPLCDIVVSAPGETSDRIQEVHMLALHALIESVEAEMGYA
jgi:D-sedoheptulose 7-phosphate isomerase